MQNTTTAMIERHRGGEKALLLYVYQDNEPDTEEFMTLCESAGLQILDMVTTRRLKLSPKYLIGSGKVDELAEIIQARGVEVVIVNHALAPAQGRNLEKAFSCRVLDRTELILDIFAARARSYEGRLQVELAQLSHLMTRLVRGWTHLERQKGGIGLRGPGETQLETDKRLLAQRVKALKRKLDKVESQRIQSRRARVRAEVPTVSLVGYTNAGKSTLFNVLTGSDVYAEDQLFATLDPTLRHIVLPGFGKMILADTVGFIKDLPHDLVRAFHATLEEVAQADLLIHVVDVSDDNASDNIDAVRDVLQQIGAETVPELIVYNKIDAQPHAHARLDLDENGLPRRVWISAHEKQGIDLLVRGLSERLACPRVKTQVMLRPNQGRLRAKLYQLNVVLSESVDDEGNCSIVVDMPEEDYYRLFPDERPAECY